MKIKVWAYRPDKVYIRAFNPENFYDKYGISYSKYKEFEDYLKNKVNKQTYKKDYQIEVVD